ncbi:MAG: hypothetical protein NTU95_00900 [Methanothrix sp.]|nr:hypothetical protein [Methanothrix sp.]
MANDVSTTEFTEDAQSEGQFFLHRRIVPEVGDHGFFAPSRAFARDQRYHAKARSLVQIPSAFAFFFMVTSFLQNNQGRRPGLELEGLGLCQG